MRMSIGLVFLFIIGITVIAFSFAAIQVRADKRARRKDLEGRARVLAESVEESVAPVVERRSRKDLQRIVERFGNREALAGLAVYDPQGRTLAITPGLNTLLARRPALVAQATALDEGRGEVLALGRNYMHIYAQPLHRQGAVVGALAVFPQAGYVEARSMRLWSDTFLRALLNTLVIALITMVIIRWSLERPIARTAQWMRELRIGHPVHAPPLLKEDLFKPLAQEVTHLAKSLEATRAMAEEEARLRQAGESLWTAAR